MVLTTHQEDLIDQYTQRLLTHEPIQYVLGYAEFYGLKFKVNSSVLIPRPETEELVRWIIEDMQTPVPTFSGGEGPGVRSVLDIGTGSGCIPISLKKKLPNANISGLDVSEDALAIAEENAELNTTEVHFSKLDILKEIPTQKYDIVVSNPPYISYDEKHIMYDNVLQYEPHLALFIDSPLLFYQRIADISSQILHANGKIYLEVSEFRAAEVAAIFLQKGFKTEIKKDMSGKERMIKAF